MTKHGWRGARLALGLLLAMLGGGAWASALFIEHLPDGRTQLALSGNGRWAETVQIEVTPAWALQASTQAWPMQVEIRPEEVRRVIAEIRLAPGAQVSFNRQSQPGLASAQHQDSYPYLRPIPAMGALAAGSAQGRAVLGEAVLVARDGIVVRAEAHDDAGYVLVAHADGTLGRYSGVRPAMDLQPGRYVNRGGVLGQGVGHYTIEFSVLRPVRGRADGLGQQAVASAVWEAAERDVRSVSRLPALPDGPPAAEMVPPVAQAAPARLSGPVREDVKFVAQVLAVTAGLLFVFPLRRRPAAAKRSARPQPASSKSFAPTQAPDAQVNLDAYASLLRAVGGDVALAQRLLAYEVKRGSHSADAAQAALERLQRDRGRSG
ncbi:M23 family metallopeptidase [Craterilacuibacter sp. RT1T]|uniref:M23 family metallopeptidase n=1 Tax=Craterilacuibacter sp. RT1T TaxID=2942211 RepID=UPI0020C05EB4|nr:M23 family metallopeptidase [Craterilacuibacter sp. RT1T]MCL6262833.1 M23 family metallopeptidase [Craterilacuibacter sp. RT1T]